MGSLYLLGMKPLSAAETAALLPYPQLAEALERVLRDKAAGVVRAPERLVMPLPGGGTLLLMPAADDEITMVKQVTVHPDQRPSVRAEVYVMDTRTGERKLVLEGATVTARRTAAVSLLAAQKLAPDPDGPLLIVGAGTQGRSHLEAFRTGLGTKKVYIASRTPEHAEALAAYACTLGLDGEIVTDLEVALEAASLIVTATTSRTPVLPDKVRGEAFIAAVGTFHPDMAEIPAELVRRSRLFVDSLEGARAEAGDLIQAGVDWGEVRGLETLVLSARGTPRPVLFKSVGHALWDLAAARLAVRVLGFGG